MTLNVSPRANYPLLTPQLESRHPAREPGPLCTWKSCSESSLRTHLTASFPGHGAAPSALSSGAWREGRVSALSPGRTGSCGGGPRTGWECLQALTEKSKESLCDFMKRENTSATGPGFYTWVTRRSFCIILRFLLSFISLRAHFRCTGHREEGHVI